MGQTRRKPAQLAICICALLLGRAVPAQAEETSLNWVRLDGAEDCIAAPALAKLVEARLGRPVLQPPSSAELSIEGRVAPRAGGGWLAILVANDRLGHRLGQRELQVAAGACSALDQPASLAVSLMIDPGAMGPERGEQGRLSPDAQRLLAQIELPNADPDELLALPVSAVSPHAQPSAPRPLDATATTHRSEASAPPVKMISVPEAEWRRMRLQAPVQTDRPNSNAVTPAWPGYVLLGLGAVAAGGFVYTWFRIDDVNTDDRFTQYRNAAFPSSKSGDVCIDAQRGLTYGLSSNTPAHVTAICNEANTLSVLEWVFLGTAVAGLTVGASWLLWIADDDAPVAVVPKAAPSFSGLQLRVRM